MRYCVVTDLSRPRVDVIMVHWEMLDDTTTPHTSLMSGTQGFRAAIYDEAGVLINETVVQARQRLRQELDRYFLRLLEAGDKVDTLYSNLLQHIGYRYPAAS